MSLLDKHAIIETQRDAAAGRLACSWSRIGGIVEIAPLFYLENTIEKVEGMRPYTPLELAGRDIYVREGCYVCHSQMIRPFRDEVERYGHYSLAAESMYDHPFQWGSKRTGPDLARVGGRYSDEWHVQHLIEPRSVVPESIMPSYAFLKDDAARHGKSFSTHLRGQRRVGVPYTEEMIANAEADLTAQADPNADTSGARGALSQGQARRFRRRPGSADRDGCAGRLSADARHAGRFLDLRRSRRLPLRRRPMDNLHAMRHFADSWGLLAMAAVLRRRRRFSPSAPAAGKQRDDAARIPLKDD